MSPEPLAETLKSVLEALQAQEAAINALIDRVEALEKRRKAQEGERDALEVRVKEVLEGHEQLHRFVHTHVTIPEPVDEGRPGISRAHRPIA